MSDILMLKMRPTVGLINPCFKIAAVRNYGEINYWETSDTQ